MRELNAVHEGEREDIAFLWTFPSREAIPSSCKPRACFRLGQLRNVNSVVRIGAVRPTKGKLVLSRLGCFISIASYLSSSTHLRVCGDTCCIALSRRFPGALLHPASCVCSRFSTTI